MPCYHVDQGRSVVLECLLHGSFELFRVLNSHTEQSRRLSDVSEARVIEFRSEFENTGSLHFKFNEGQRAIVENDNFNRQIELLQRQQFSHQHRQPAVTGKGDDLAIWKRRLRTDGLRQRIGH